MSGSLTGTMERYKEANEQTFFKCSERIDGVKTLGWELIRTDLTPSWLYVTLPQFPSS